MATEAQHRVKLSHWGTQIWIHLARNLVLLKRELRSMVLLNLSLIAILMILVRWTFAGINIPSTMTRTTIVFLVLNLLQSFAAQRYFGGDQREMAIREVSVTSLSQVMYAFVGKDVVGVMEIWITSLVYSLVHWSTYGSTAPLPDVFEVGFGVLYAMWGLNHMLAIRFTRATAQSGGIVFSFMSFLFVGVTPTAKSLYAQIGDSGIYMMMLSPVRWGFTMWLRADMTSEGSPWTTNMRALAERPFRAKGFELDGVDKCSDYSAGVAERWSMLNSSWTCDSTQMFLLGFLFRFLALVFWLEVSNAKCSGGQVTVGAPTARASRVARDYLAIFVVFAFILSLALMGYTH